MEKRLILRGVIAGAVAGLPAFVFARIFAEPQIATAIDYESGRDAAPAVLVQAAGITAEAAAPHIFSPTIPANAGIGRGLLGRADLILPHLKTRRVAIVTNAVVGPLYLERLRAGLEAAGVRTAAVVLPMNYQKKWVIKTTQNDSLIATALRDHMAKTGVKTLGFIGTADSPVLLGSLVILGVDVVLGIIAYRLLATGWKTKS